MNTKPETVIETKRIKVTKQDKKYNVYSDGVLRYPDCTSEDVMRALGQYLMNYEHQTSVRIGKSSLLSSV